VYLIIATKRTILGRPALFSMLRLADLHRVPKFSHEVNLYMEKGKYILLIENKVIKTKIY
jgi:hypothetical protein